MAANTSTLTPVEVLRESKSLIRMMGWARKAWAVDSDGKPVDSQSPRACAFCAVGAVSRVTETAEAAGTGLFSNSMAFLHRAARELFGERFDAFDVNDKLAKTVDDIFRLFDRAIALAEAEAAR